MEIMFSVSGYFMALSKIIDQGYGTQPIQFSDDKTPEQRKEHIDNKKQATYFALYALLEFIINV